MILRALHGGVPRDLTPEERASIFLQLLGNWTTEPPTEPGWYWAYNTQYPLKDYTQNGPEIVQVYDHETKGLCVGEYSNEAVRVKDYGTHWLGPLPIPEPPK